MGRSQKALKNVSTGLINKVAIMLFSFTTKTAFIRLLGAEYNGVSSLYTSILSVLALAELGLGNVLMFYLYSALEKGDTDKICALTQEFKKIYNIIIICVSLVGVAIVPFLEILVKSDLPHKELIIYYLLYLLNSVVSYFVIYRTMVIRADQKEYLLNNCSTITTIIMYVLQLIYLCILRDFLGYLLIQVFCTIGNNLVQNQIALKKYPYLKKKCSSNVDIVDKKGIFQNVKATFLFKVSDTILDQADNIIISMMFGTVMVGYYANYYMVMAYLVQIASIIVSGLIASFGNLYVTGEKQRSYNMIKCIMFFFSVFGTYCVACYMSVIQDFISIWVGSEYVMGIDLIIAVMVVFYLRMVTNTVWICRSTMGIFKEVQYVHLIAIVLNILFSIILGYAIGVAGIIVATAISRIFTSFWYEGKIVFNKLEKSAKEYYLIQLRSVLIASIIVGTSVGINHFILMDGIGGMVLKIIVCTGITIFAEVLFNRKTLEFRMLTERILRMVKK
ncbi:MAG: hypothetical protein HFI46_08420 [Lachnospiraceae bacterium]|nr:hypothetical protein [Lachnospiraceae bacterium]